MNPSAVLRNACVLEPLEGRRLLSSSVWEIHGDTAKNKSDVILVDLSPADSSLLRATVNGTVVATRSVAKVKSIRILAGTGDDDVTVNLGSPIPGLRVVVVAGAGNDSVTITGATSSQVTGGTGDDTLRGGSGNDLLDGGSGDDLLQGNGGFDTLLGGDGDDLLAGGTGRDQLDGGTGDDRLLGGANPDKLIGGAGTDTLTGGAGYDVFAPGAGHDKIYKTAGADKVLGNDGDIFLNDTSADPAFQRFAGESDFDAWLIDAATRRWQDLFGQPVERWFFGWGGGPMTFKTGSSRFGSNTLTDTPSAANATGGNDDHSTTNNQVDGVDEADIVQTDGTYLYTAVGNELVVVSADPADHLAVVSRTDVGGYISGLYLTGNKLTVLASVYDQLADTTLSYKRNALVAGDVWWNASKTLVATYDVSNAAAPTVAESTTLDGYLADSRSIDGRVYAVIGNDLWLPPPKLTGTGDDRRYESESDYRQRLRSIVAQRQLPQFTTTAGATTRTGSLVSVPDTYVSGDNADTESLTSVVLIDPSTGDIGPDASATVVGPSGTIYASADSLYVTGWDWDEDTGVEQTNLAKFSLGASAISLAAVGTVEGSIIDQYSMGENSHGDLNIATSSGWGNDSANNVYTLRQSGTNLDPVGAILDLAPGERIFSSRFVGDQGYLVTYQQTDPLFSLDLSDPTDPHVAGQLDLTGFSSFLQPIEGHYLLGLGHSGDSDGNVGGLQLSLFDILDPAHPSLVATYAFDAGDPSTGSDAEYDPHAIQYFPAQHTLALPIWKYDSNTDDFTEGTALLKIDTTTGFQPLGFVTQPGATRSVRINQTLYTLGSDTIIASDLNAPSTIFSTVTIATDDDGGSDSGDDGGLMPL